MIIFRKNKGPGWPTPRTRVESVKFFNSSVSQTVSLMESSKMLTPHKRYPDHDQGVPAHWKSV